jgi:glycosyltransferase involved in cell wall biosynthesis
VLACDYLLKYTLGLGHGLERQGCSVALVARDHGGEFGGDAGAMRAEIDRRLSDAATIRLLRGRVRDVRALGRVGAARRAVARPDAVVHMQAAVANDFRLALAAGVPPRRFALTVHDPVMRAGDPRMGLRKRLSGLALVRGARVIFVHGETLRDELRDGGVRTPIEVVPHGADAARAQPLPESPVLLFFGRLTEYKGLDVLCDAMAEVWRSVPATRLVIAGSGSLPASSVLDDDRVEVRNEHVPEDAVRDLFARATAVVLPYREASQSGVGSEAKTHGRALVVTDAGALPELVADGSGLVASAGSSSDLAGQLVRVLGEPGLAARLAEAGSATVATASSWGAVAGLTLDAYARHGLLSR